MLHRACVSVTELPEIWNFFPKCEKKQTPWSLNSLGAFAGELMLRDHDYIQETRDLILDERDRMEQELQISLL